MHPGLVIISSYNPASNRDRTFPSHTMRAIRAHYPPRFAVVFGIQPVTADPEV